MRLVLFLTCVLNYLFLGSILAQQSTFQHFTTQHGLAALKVNMVYCDGEGRIWAVTRKGVSVYDGHSFQSLMLADSLLNNDIRCIFEGSKGDIYLLSAGGIQRRQAGKPALSWRSTRSLLEHVETPHLDENAGLIYLSSSLDRDSLPVLRLSTGQFEYQKKPSEDSFLRYFPVHLNNFGRRYQYSMSAFDHQEGFTPQDSLFFRHKYRPGAPFSVENKALLIPLHNFKPQIILSSVPNRHPDDMIFCDDRVLVLHDYARQLEHRYLLPYKPIDINSITADKQGNIWIGSEQGLYKLYSENIWHYTEIDGVPHMPWGVSELGRDHYVISSYSVKPFYQLRNQKISLIRNAPTGVRAYLNSRNMPGGKVLLTSSSGAFLYDGEQFKRIDHTESHNHKREPNAQPAYLSSYVDSLSGDIMLGGVNLFVWYNTKGELQHRLAGADLNSKLGVSGIGFNILAIAPIGGDTLMLGSSSGYIFYHKPSKRILKQHVFSDTLLNQPDNLMVWSAASDYKNRLWYASTRQGSGLIRYNPERDEFIQVAKGLISDNVSSVAMVNGGKILLAGGSTQMLAIHLPRYYAGDKNCYFIMDMHNGLPATEFVQNAIMQDSQGFIWVCTNDNNIYRFRLHEYLFDLPVSKTSMSSIERFNQKEFNWETLPFNLQDSSFSFGVSERSLRFSLTSITQMAPEHLRFFYRLRRYGEDWPKEWQEAEDGQFLLSEMTAGMHELQLKCAYFYYSHHERALINTYSLYFEYKWSETLWFQFVVAFFCIVSGSLVYYSVKMAQDKKAKSIEILEINKRLQKTNEEVTKQATELKKRQQELDSHNLKIGELYKSVSESNEVLRQQKNEISTQAELLSDAYERLEIKNKEISFLKESLEHDLKNNLLKMQNIVDFPLESISPEGKETFRRYQAELAGILKTYRYMLAKEQHSANMLKELAEEECDRHYRPDIEVKMYCNMSFNRPEHRDRLPQINIIVTELARNAAKHAFPLRIQDPQIIFRIEPDEENRITITYQDNGIGIKDMASISTDAKGIALFRRVSIDQYFVCHNQPDGGLYVAIRLDNRPMLL